MMPMRELEIMVEDQYQSIDWLEQYYTNSMTTAQPLPTYAFFGVAAAVAGAAAAGVAAAVAGFSPLPLGVSNMDMRLWLACTRRMASASNGATVSCLILRTPAAAGPNGTVLVTTTSSICTHAWHETMTITRGCDSNNLCCYLVARVQSVVPRHPRTSHVQQTHTHGWHLVSLILQRHAQW